MKLKRDPSTGKFIRAPDGKLAASCTCCTTPPGGPNTCGCMPGSISVEFAGITLSIPPYVSDCSGSGATGIDGDPNGTYTVTHPDGEPCTSYRLDLTTADTPRMFDCAAHVVTTYYASRIFASIQYFPNSSDCYVVNISFGSDANPAFFSGSLSGVTDLSSPIVVNNLYTSSADGAAGYGGTATITITGSTCATCAYCPANLDSCDECLEVQIASDSFTGNIVVRKGTTGWSDTGARVSLVCLSGGTWQAQYTAGGCSITATASAGLGTCPTGKTWTITSDTCGHATVAVVTTTCPSDCSTCCLTYIIETVTRGFSLQYTQSTGDLAGVPLGGTDDCEWWRTDGNGDSFNSSDYSANGKIYKDVGAGLWRLTYVDGADTFSATASLAGNTCPPTDVSAWTITGESFFSISTSGCP